MARKNLDNTECANSWCACILTSAKSVVNRVTLSSCSVNASFTRINA